MSARLAAAKSLSFTAVASYEYPNRLGPPIVYTMRYDGAEAANLLKVVVPGDGPAEFTWDGKGDGRLRAGRGGGGGRRAGHADGALKQASTPRRSTPSPTCCCRPPTPPSRPARGWPT